MTELVGKRRNNNTAQIQRRKQALEPPFTRVINKSLGADSLGSMAYAQVAKDKS